MVTKSITFSPKLHPQHLYFRWHNSITGWMISKISTPFHHALMDLELRRSVMENSNEQLRYSRKTSGCNFAPTLFEGFTHYDRVLLLISFVNLFWYYLKNCVWWNRENVLKYVSTVYIIALDFWFKAADTGIISKRGNTLVCLCRIYFGPFAAVYVSAINCRPIYLAIYFLSSVHILIKLF